MKGEFDDVVRDTYRYFYADGLVEMAIGFLFLVIGLVLLAWIAVDVSSWPSIMAILALIAFAIGATAVAKAGVHAFKEHVTYQRTGYVAYHHGEPQVGRWPIVGTAALLAILLTLVPDALNQMSFSMGAILCVLLAYTAYRVHLRRFYLLGGFILFLGLSVSLLVRDELLGASLTIVGCGLGLIMSGVVVLLDYLRANPLLDRE